MILVSSGVCFIIKYSSGVVLASNQLTQLIQDCHFLPVYNLFDYGTSNIIMDEISTYLFYDLRQNYVIL